MTAAAILREADARRLAKIAKAEGVAVRVKVGNREITIIPDPHRLDEDRHVDGEKEIIL